jgi:hypothetical protein
VLVAALLIAMYSTARVFGAAREIRKRTGELQALERRLISLAPRMMQSADEAVTSFEERVDGIVMSLKVQLADLVEQSDVRTTDMVCSGAGE